MVLFVRPLQRDDRSDWQALWSGYLAVMGIELTQEEYDIQFDRRLSDDPQDPRCLIAVQDGRAIGLAHYLFQRDGWRTEDTCYLQDLYVAPSMRDYGAGQTLIGAVFATADAFGAPQVYWLTQNSDRSSRKLYDRIGILTSFVKYERQ
ncbi:hypothetical protein LCGC14_2873220 [marine sediment metagenome]|uniref:N-acetyltransferase domain-containing protein n=1 Tax=marine sediment metagenome TaxID=412755 RepID=A0A0F8Y286_9ZZZZ